MAPLVVDLGLQMVLLSYSLRSLYQAFLVCKIENSHRANIIITITISFVGMAEKSTGSSPNLYEVPLMHVVRYGRVVVTVVVTAGVGKGEDVELFVMLSVS